jgi:hypothetical protein
MASEPWAAGAARSNDQRQSRAAYALVGTAARESIARTISWAAEHPHQKQVSRNMRVLLAVHFLTACYSRVSDRVYVAQVATVAQLDEDRAQKALSFWHRLGVIEWQGSKGRGRASCVSLPNGGEKTRPLLAVVATENPASSVGKTRSVLTPKTRPVLAPPTEKYSEKTSEDDVEVAFRKIIDPLGYATPSQLAELRQAFDEDPAGLAARAGNVRTADRPIAVLLVAVRDGAHRGAGPPTRLERALAWARRTAPTMMPDDREVVLADFGLSADEEKQVRQAIAEKAA